MTKKFNTVAELEEAVRKANLITAWQLGLVEYPFPANYYKPSPNAQTKVEKTEIEGKNNVQKFGCEK